MSALPNSRFPTRSRPFSHQQAGRPRLCGLQTFLRGLALGHTEEFFSLRSHSQPCSSVVCQLCHSRQWTRKRIASRTLCSRKDVGFVTDLSLGMSHFPVPATKALDGIDLRKGLFWLLVSWVFFFRLSWVLPHLSLTDVCLPSLSLSLVMDTELLTLLHFQHGIAPLWKAVLG